MKAVTLRAPTYKELRALHLLRKIYLPKKVKLTPTQYSELCKNFAKGYEKLKENDDSNRKLKLLRFANDYCRSSPNMQLKDRHSLLELGWRPCKSEYLIDYELFDYVIGEQRQVSYFFKIFSLNQS